jgi:ppGpp synthetase/RelA/SpoT-type nucleotidyltranferase
MSRRKKGSKEAFIYDNNLKEQFESAERINPDLWGMLNKIEHLYVERAENSKSLAQGFLVSILGDAELSKIIHSARYRVKDINSLKVKIVKKLGQLSIYKSNDYDKEKYRDIDENNYYKIITDLIGVRIIIRYREQWSKVDKWITEHFSNDSSCYLKNYICDYKSDPDEPFIVEIPKVYYRSDQDKVFYEYVKENCYSMIPSKSGYNSVHYIINKDGKYIEIQVRTIYDEAWSECTHDIVYKNKKLKRSNEIDYISKCLSQQTIAAETMVNYMYELVNGTNIIYRDLLNRDKKEEDKRDSDITYITEKINIEKRMDLLSQNKQESFSGNIDDLI